MPASKETINAYKTWAEANADATYETKLGVFRIYDNHQMSLDEAREAFKEFEEAPEQLDLQLEDQVASNSQADVNPAQRGKL